MLLGLDRRDAQANALWFESDFRQSEIENLRLSAIRDEDVAAFRALLEKAHAGDAWISDGNFAVASFDIRLPRATLVIWLEASKISCRAACNHASVKKR